MYYCTAEKLMQKLVSYPSAWRSCERCSWAVEKNMHFLPIFCKISRYDTTTLHTSPSPLASVSLSLVETATRFLPALPTLQWPSVLWFTQWAPHDSLIPAHTYTHQLSYLRGQRVLGLTIVLCSVLCTDVSTR